MVLGHNGSTFRGILFAGNAKAYLVLMERLEHFVFLSLRPNVYFQ